jgi:pimeloyl-ACP methyl ester carboxylesterase
MIEMASISEANWRNITNDLAGLLKINSIRQASFYVYGDGCAIAQSYYLDQPKVVRSMVLINPSTRAHPGHVSKIIDRLEELLPLGLPLRSSAKGFDGRSFLQRIRCPVLIVLTPSPTAFLRQQARLMESGLPTSWILQLQNKSSSGLFDPEELFDHISVFQQIPAKSPQKNLMINQETNR